MSTTEPLTASRPRVLIVDDSEDTRAILSLMVDKAGAEATVAVDAADAFAKVEEAVDAAQPFVLILMDIRMPKMSGVEATKQLREAGYRGCIVACTAVASGSGRKQSISAGFDAYFDKKSLKKETVQALIAEAASKESPIKESPGNEAS